MFREGSAIGRLARQARGTEQLGEVLRGGLPADLAGALHSASIRGDGTLVVIASSPAWAARLRFEGERLLALCAGMEPAPTRLKLRVRGAKN